jgi:biopolymer transport protein ExbD
MELGFSRPVRRHTRELSVVPILDMMTTLIVFLLQITSFLEYTKITLPPSSTSIITDPMRPPPLTPKFFLMEGASNGTYKLQLSWSGPTEGYAKRELEAQSDEKLNAQAIRQSAASLMEEFWKTYPSESTLQLGLESKLSYQDMISVMDGIQDGFKKNKANGSTTLANLVLTSYVDVDAELALPRGSP